MKIAIALLLNAALWAVLLPWLQRQWRWAVLVGWRWIFALGLGLRAAVGLWRGLPPKFDAGYMTQIGDTVTRLLWNGEWHVVIQPVTTFPEANGAMVYQSTSNTWMLIKLLALLNFLTVSQAWLNAFYLSLFAFMGCWALARVLAELFPQAPAGAGPLALLLWPSVWFWATGISKEAVLLGAGAWLTARVLARLYTAKSTPRHPMGRGAGWWMGTGALAVLHLAMRYFFAVPLLAVLAALALGRGLERWLPRRWAVVAGLVSVFGLGAWAGPELSVGLRLNKFVNQVMRVYRFDVEHSAGRPHFEYPDLRPTLESIAAHAPQAVANTLTQPWLGQSGQLLYVAAALENAALLLLLALAGWALVRGRGGHLPFSVVLVFGVFCLLLAFLMGITTPNLGSLHRYRSTMLPFLLLLLLQNDYAAAALRRWLPGRRPAGEPQPVPTPNA